MIAVNRSSDKFKNDALSILHKYEDMPFTRRGIDSFQYEIDQLLNYYSDMYCIDFNDVCHLYNSIIKEYNNVSLHESSFVENSIQSCVEKFGHPS